MQDGEVSSLQVWGLGWESLESPAQLLGAGEGQPPAQFPVSLRGIHCFKCVASGGVPCFGSCW